jgi:hypothetical protein
VDTSKDLVIIRSIEEAQKLRSSRNIDNIGRINMHDIRGSPSLRGQNDEGDDRSRPSSRSIARNIKSREPEIVDLANLDEFEHHHASPRIRDARDDLESRQSSRSSKRGSSKQIPSAGNWPDYETIVSATKELRKLEKKIEKQLRQAKRENKEEWDASTVSSKEIRKLEKQLAQKLKRENEKRAAKLKRIKRKVPKANASPVVEKPGTPQIPGPLEQTKTKNISESAFGLENEPSIPPLINKGSIHKVVDFRDRSKFDQLRVLRSSRYGRGVRSHPGSPEERD